MDELRTERSFGVTAELKPVQRLRLLGFQRSDVYADVLDVLEMVCIEHESRLINTDAEDEAAVLANHKMAKAAWQLFVHMQEKIDNEGKLYLASVATKPPVPELTETEQFIENLINPLNPPPEGDDYMGI